MGARLTLHISDFEKIFMPFEHFLVNFSSKMGLRAWELNKKS
jgi:hypothetical protein